MNIYIENMAGPYTKDGPNKTSKEAIRLENLWELDQ
jgi:hypothetical protein